MKPPYEYAAEAVYVVDGDTIDVVLDFGFSLKQKMRLRLAGIDTPELRSKDEAEREKAQHAKFFVKNALFYDDNFEESVDLIVKTLKTKSGKERQTFGRYVAEVFFRREGGEWESLTELLVAEGLAETSKW